MSEEKLVKLLRGTKQDMLIAFEFLHKYSTEEIQNFFNKWGDIRNGYTGKDYTSNHGISRPILEGGNFWKNCGKYTLYVGNDNIENSVIVVISSNWYRLEQYKYDSPNLYT